MEEFPMQTKLTTLAVAVALTAMASLPVQAANTTGAPMPNKFWWPDQLDLSVLRAHDARSNPLSEDYDTAKEIAKLELDAVKADVK